VVGRTARWAMHTPKLWRANKDTRLAPCARRGPHALRRFAVLGACVTGVFAASFGPFVLAGQLRQVRLAPRMVIQQALSR